MGRMWMGAALALALAGCGSGDDAPVAGLSAEEAAQLNNAAEMLDASPDSLAAPEDMPLGGESNSDTGGADGASAGNASTR